MQPSHCLAWLSLADLQNITSSSTKSKENQRKDPTRFFKARPETLPRLILKTAIVDIRSL